MELKDTIKMMESEDYKERFKAEYHQLEIRIKKLATLLEDWKKDKLKFTPTCSFYLLEKQLQAMVLYSHFLCERAEIEKIVLYDY